jgi:hypothetical protein
MHFGWDDRRHSDLAAAYLIVKQVTLDREIPIASHQPPHSTREHLRMKSHEFNKPCCLFLNWDWQFPESFGGGVAE